MDITSIIFITLKISVLSTIISFVTSVLLSIFVLRYNKFTFITVTDLILISILVKCKNLEKILI